MKEFCRLRFSSARNVVPSQISPVKLGMGQIWILAEIGQIDNTGLVEMSITFNSVKSKLMKVAITF
jgi:hypothetical protein